MSKKVERIRLKSRIVNEQIFVFRFDFIFVSHPYLSNVLNGLDSPFLLTQITAQRVRWNLIKSFCLFSMTTNHFMHGEDEKFFILRLDYNLLRNCLAHGSKNLSLSESSFAGYKDESLLMTLWCEVKNKIVKKKFVHRFRTDILWREALNLLTEKMWLDLS